MSATILTKCAHRGKQNAFVTISFPCILVQSLIKDSPCELASLHFHQNRNIYVIDDFRGACAVKGNVQVAGRTSRVSTTEMLSTHDVTLRNVDGSLFHVQI